MPNAMKVVLINPRATYAGEIAQKCYPPMNLMYLSASLRAQGHEPRIVDANAHNMPDDEIVEAVAREAPGIVGMPLFSTISAHVYRLCALVRERAPDAKIVLGGPEASALPVRTLEDFPHIDFVLRGESEQSICALCGAIENGDSLESVAGLTRRAEDGIVSNPDVVLGRDLDALPRPARDLAAEEYAQGLYYSVLVRSRPVDTIITSRGCPFRCGFCYNMNHTYRFRSPEDVLDEMCEIVSRGIRDIEIVDDTFTVRRERAMAIFRLIRRERLPVSFRIKSRVNAVDKEFLREAKRAGVYLISYGVESGVQEILDSMNKRTTVEQNAQAIRWAKDAGIMCHASFVLGYPGETPDTIKQTVRFISTTRPTTVNLVALVPFPQTAVYGYAKEHGMLMGNWDAQTDYVPWVKLRWMKDRGDLDRWAQWARRAVYFTPPYVSAFAAEIMRNANWLLGRYALQEARKVLPTVRGPRLF